MTLSRHSGSSRNTNGYKLMAESYRVSLSEQPTDLAGPELEDWIRKERARMCAEMHALADFLFGPEETLPPGDVEIH